MAGNRLKQLAADQKMVGGVTQHLMGLATIMVGGVAMKPADIVTRVTGRIVAAKAVEVAEANHAAAVTANNAVLGQTHQFMLDLEQAVEVQVGPAVDTLADFGLTPKKKGAPTAATKAAAAAKAKATRALHKAAKTATAPVAAPAAAPVPAAGTTPAK
jgi:hypothetical protein